VTHVFTVSAIQSVPLEKIKFLRRVEQEIDCRMAASEYHDLDERSPFSVFSGVQQTGVGLGGADRPDQVAKPDALTSRTIREDYFGRGADNGSSFQFRRRRFRIDRKNLACPSGNRRRD